MKQLMKPKSLLLSLGLLVAPVLLTSTAIAQDQSKEPTPYPLETCLVSGEKLGSMGEPYVINHNGQEVKFCCKNCVKDFNKDPEKYLKKMQETEAAAKAADAHEGHAH